MRRSRVTEGPQSHKTSSSESDPPLHSRVNTERGPKLLSEGRSPGGAQSNPSNQKKLSTRIADLESQLGHAQEELKGMKNQIVSTDVVRKATQDQPDKRPKKQEEENVHDPVEINEKKHFTTIRAEMPHKNDHAMTYETSDDNTNQETDVEIHMEEVSLECKKGPELPVHEDDFKPKSVIMSDESPDTSRPENLLLNLNDEACMLKRQLEEKDKELEAFRRENERLKNQLDYKSVKMSSAESEIDELILRLNKVEEELEDSRSHLSRILEKMETAEKAKDELANEMNRLTVQTEQWRKAADAAASVLASGSEMTIVGRRISERCGSMGNMHYGSSVERLGGFAGYAGSPIMMDDPGDAFGSEKRKGSSIKMFGDLLRKKGHK